MLKRETALLGVLSVDVVRLCIPKREPECSISTTLLLVLIEPSDESLDLLARDENCLLLFGQDQRQRFRRAITQDVTAHRGPLERVAENDRAIIPLRLRLVRVLVAALVVLQRVLVLAVRP